MKTITYFAAAVIFCAACNNTQQQAAKISQARADSMAQVLERQHIIDSINAVSTATTNPAYASPATTYRRPVTRRRPVSYEHSNSYGGNMPAANAVTPAPPASSTAVAPPPAASTPVQPLAPDPDLQRKADNKKIVKSTVVGGLIGAGAGAAAGALAGKNAQFKKQDAGIGAGAGAILGAGAGWLIEKHKLKKADTTNKK